MSANDLGVHFVCKIRRSSGSEDIAKRAGLSRTLLYRIFEDKEDIYRAVFVDWLVSRHPAAKKAANGPGSAYGHRGSPSLLSQGEHVSTAG